MLFCIDGKQITDVPRSRREEFNIWRNRLADSDYEMVVKALNEHVDAVPRNKPFVSSHIPGHDFTDTPYQPLYIACGKSFEQTGWFFGLILWQVMIDHRENWIFKSAEKEDKVQGTTYWRKKQKEHRMEIRIQRDQTDAGKRDTTINIEAVGKCCPACTATMDLVLQEPSFDQDVLTGWWYCVYCDRTDKLAVNASMFL